MISSRAVFRVGIEDHGKRLDEFLAARLGRLSRIRIARLVKEGRCRVNEKTEDAGSKVKAGDIIDFEIIEGAPTAMTPEPIPLDIVFEDAHIIVVVKPAGMLVHPTIAAKTGTLANALAHYLNRDRDLNPGCELIRPGFVHRLDRATSGLLVVAKSQQALSVLSRHFRKRIVQKRYLALAHGCVLEDEGVITGPIGRDPNRRPQWWIAENGKPAETRYRVLQRLTKGSLVELEPVTGRTNQLRIHCAYIGHPIIGDEFYGPASGSSPTPGRLFLHASRLAFNHPRTGQPLVFASELPAELCAFLANEDV